MNIELNCELNYEAEDFLSELNEKLNDCFDEGYKFYKEMMLNKILHKKINDGIDKAYEKIMLNNEASVKWIKKLEKINKLNELNKLNKVNDEEIDKESDTESDEELNSKELNNGELNVVINKLVDVEACKIDKELLLTIETFLHEKNVLNDEMKEEIMMCEKNLVKDESLNDYFL